MLGNGLPLPEQHAAALRPGRAFPCHASMTMCGATSAGDREIRRRACGWSRLVDGSAQTFQWGALFRTWSPHSAVRGSARCSRHNFVFLEGVKAALPRMPPARRVVRRRPRGFARLRASMPAGVSAGVLPPEARTSRALRLRLAGGLPGRVLGGLLPAERRQQPAGPCSGLGRTATSARTTLQERLQGRRLMPSRARAVVMPA